MFDTIFASIAANPGKWTAVSMYIGLAIINTAPNPAEIKNHTAGELFYQWVYDFLHVLSNRAIDRYPKIPNQPDPNGSK